MYALHMKIWQPMVPDEDAMVEIELPGGSAGAAVKFWEAAARDGARILFGMPGAREMRDPGARVIIRYEPGDSSEEDKRRHDVAIAAFNKEWAALVPGWRDPHARTEQELGGGSDQIRR